MRTTTLALAWAAGFLAVTGSQAAPTAAAPAPTTTAVAAPADTLFEPIGVTTTATIPRKGAMVKVLTAEGLEGARAHQLRLTFHPALVKDQVVVKLFDKAGTSLASVPLATGARIVLDLDPGPTSLQVMVEEQGVTEKPITIFASLHRFLAAPGANGAGGGTRVGRSGAVDKPKDQAPKEVVAKKEVNLEKVWRGRGLQLSNILRRLKLQRSQAEEFVYLMVNAMANVRSTQLRSAVYFLDQAEKLAPCAEIEFWRAITLDVFDLPRATRHLDQSLAYFKNGTSAGALLERYPAELYASAHGLAAAYCLRTAIADPKISDASLAVLQGAMDEHLRQAERLDREGTRERRGQVTQKWQEFLQVRKAGGAPEAQLAKPVSDFLRARALFDAGKRTECLEVLDTTAGLPEGDAQFLRADILAAENRIEDHRAALEASIAAFDAGRCLGGAAGGTVAGAQGTLPPASLRAALARMSLARYFAARFKDATADPVPEAKRPEVLKYIEKAIALVEAAMKAVPAQASWNFAANSYREERLKFMFPNLTGPRN